jgi:hypothetical protein
VGQELGRFDPANRVLNQQPELFALFVADGRPERGKAHKKPYA